MSSNTERRPASEMMSRGFDPSRSEGAINLPDFGSSTFVGTAEELEAAFEVVCGLRRQLPGEPLPLIYSRLNHPGAQIFEERLALWEDAEACVAFASGMAAITVTFFSCLYPGDVLLHSEPLYGGTDHLIKDRMKKWGVKSIGFTCSDSWEDVARKIEEAGGRLRMIFIETPANPTNALVDIAEWVKFARAYEEAHEQKSEQENGRVLVAVDNTFLGPLWQHPLKHGADLVICSATKYIGGHSDLLAGACLGSAEVIAQIREWRTSFGSIVDTRTASQLLSHLKTLDVRLPKQMENAKKIAEFLLGHPKVTRVYYPGCLNEKDPQHAIYKKQCEEPGAMISFDIAGGKEEAFRLLNALKLIKLAVSLGGVESLAEHPYRMTHLGVDPELKARLGITDSMIRLSVGKEDAEDIIADLRSALKCV